jgi:hypothetical protein
MQRRYKKVDFEIKKIEKDVKEIAEMVDEAIKKLEMVAA